MYVMRWWSDMVTRQPGDKAVIGTGHHETTTCKVLDLKYDWKNWTCSCSPVHISLIVYCTCSWPTSCAHLFKLTCSCSPVPAHMFLLICSCPPAAAKKDDYKEVMIAIMIRKPLTWVTFSSMISNLLMAVWTLGPFWVFLALELLYAIKLMMSYNGL